MNVNSSFNLDFYVLSLPENIKNIRNITEIYTLLFIANKLQYYVHYKYLQTPSIFVKQLVTM